MRHSLLILVFILYTQLLLGQASIDSLVPKELLDSIQREHALLKAKFNDLYWKSMINHKGTRVDTAFKHPDSTVLNYYSADGKLILCETTQLNDQKRLIPYHQQYFDNEGRVIYVKNWIVMTGDVWDAMMEKEERIEYDGLGRKTLHSVYHSTLNKKTERTIYWYDNDGRQHKKTSVSKGYMLWR